MRNYYMQIHKYLEKLVLYAILLDKKGFKENNDQLSIVDLSILKAVGKQEERKMFEVMEELHMDRNSFGAAVNKLQMQNYVRKIKSDEDKRMYLLQLTEKGKRVFEKTTEKEKEMLFSLLQDFTLNEEKTILKFLVKMDMFNKGKK